MRQRGPKCTVRGPRWWWALGLGLALQAVFTDLSAHAVDLAQDERWLRLLHMPHAGARSRVVSHEFFFAPDGSSNASAELVATIAAFRQRQPAAGRLRQEPACAFPARFRLLRSAVPGPWPEPDCRDFNEWRNALGTTAVSLVFASSYPLSPASMFGHVFLRLDSGSAAVGSKSMQPLLGYAVAYAADIQDFNPLTYIPYGLGGGFRGRFSVDPYYLKLKEYGAIESRDLWSYRLELTPTQRDRLLEHLWELLYAADFDYYFLGENCAYQLLALLETVDPNVTLLAGSPWPLLPRAAVTAVARSHLASGEVAVQISEQRALLARLSSLPAAQRAEAQQLRAGNLPSKSADAETLDAALAWLRFEKFRDGGDSSARDGAQLDRVLLARAALGRSDRPDLPSAPPPPHNRPDRGHAPAAVSVGVIAGTPRPYAVAAARLGYHAAGDDPEGYEPHFGLVYGAVAVAGDATRMLPPRVTLVEAVNRTPMNALSSKPSWRAQVGYNTTTPLWCDDCRAADARIGIGYTLGSAAHHWLLSAFSDLTLATRPHRSSLRPDASLLLTGRLHPRLRVRGELTRDLRPDAWQGSRRPWKTAGSLAANLEQLQIALNYDGRLALESTFYF